MPDFIERMKKNRHDSNGHSGNGDGQSGKGERYFGDEIASQILEAVAVGNQMATDIAHAGINDFGYCEGTPGVSPGGWPMSTNPLGTGFNTPSVNVYNPFLSFPRERRRQLGRVDFWLENDELLERLTRVKQEFTVMGLSLRAATKGSDNDSEADISNGNSKPSPFDELNIKLERILKKWDWGKIVEDLLWDWFSKDTMILYWKLEVTDPEDVIDGQPIPPEPRSKEELAPGLEEVCSLNPSECDWRNSMGQDMLRYFIPQHIKLQIQEANNKSGPERILALEKLIDAGLQAKYIIAVIKGLDYVDLKKEDGDNWLICTKARKRHGIAKPSMYSIFLPLEIRKMVSEGEFSAAILMKYLMLHAKRGESITQGPMAGQRLNWAKSGDITQLHNMIKDPARATRVVTDHTVKFEFVFPPKDVWNQEKFQTCDTRIYNWAGVTVVMMTGQSGTNAGGYIGIKRMISSMTNARGKIALMIFEHFDCPQMKKIYEVPDDVDVKAIFDENVLKEPRQLLDETKFIVTEGLGDPEISLRELGRDPETVRASKLRSIRDNQKTRLWEPVYIKTAGGATTVGQRQVSQSDKGRPANQGTQVDEGTRTQSTPVS